MNFILDSLLEVCKVIILFHSFIVTRCVCPSPDVNDNVPFFLSSTYEATVPEGAEIGASVAQVSATDLDSGLHGMVRILWHL